MVNRLGPAAHPSDLEGSKSQSLGHSDERSLLTRDQKAE